jgi:F-box/WD-40 domain protein 7
MPISSSLSARLGPGPAPSFAQAPARWSPYARPSEPREGGSGSAKAGRPPLRLEPATARLLGPARKSPAIRSSYATEAVFAGRTRRRIRDEESDQKTDPKPAETNPEPNKEPRVEESRGCGGFAFLGALAGHTEVRV